MPSTSASVLIAALFLVASASSSSADAKPDTFDPRLIGSWKVIECIENGKDWINIDVGSLKDPLKKIEAETKREAILKVVFVFEESNLRTVLDGKTQDEVTISTNCAKSPCTMEYTTEEEGKAVKRFAIYKFSDDKLIFAGGAADPGALTSFESKPNSGITRMVLERLNEKKTP